jgi:cell pole-organizing protein PopZ
MEEILASIRKIIAEESPGSRSVSMPPRPGAPSTPAPALQRGFMSREAFMRSSRPVEPEPSEPAFSPPRVDELKETTVERVAARGPSSPAQPLEQRNTTVISESQIEPEAPHPDRDQKFAAEKFAAERDSDAVASAEPVVETKLEPKFEPAENRASDAASIDAQLSELLGENLKALREAEKRDAGAERMTAETGFPPPEKADERPFSDTRLTLSSPRASVVDEDLNRREASDPFAFDLGPSPFSRSPAEKPAERPEPAGPVPAQEPPASVTHPLEHNPRTSAYGPGNGFASPSALAEPGASGTPVYHEPSPAPRTRATFAVPSVAATLGPDRTLEPLRASFEQAPTEAPPSGSNRLSSDAFTTDSDDRDPVTAHTEPPREKLNSLQPASVSDIDLDRAIEDTVADLLRPMLRTWLAENMPKIVERALRREMSERLMASRKNNTE